MKHAIHFDRAANREANAECARIGEEFLEKYGHLSREDRADILIQEVEAQNSPFRLSTKDHQL